ncbi:hypothetical protein BJY24_002762 [Nocardia transvalensis]|uniref:Uncharacterized protein n=1 Tax=Nocardia transvalensis TaxID=37333 RepID=A0A7W9PD91_9NOCA|nr:hypothetical protein [Nocardia transvalensis]
MTGIGPVVVGVAWSAAAESGPRVRGFVECCVAVTGAE